MLVEPTPRVPRKILIHLPNNPGGKVNYFTAIKDHFANEVSFFLCGKQGRKESKLDVLKRMLRDFWEYYQLLRKGKFDVLITNPTLDAKSFFRDSIFTLIGCLLGVKTIVFWHGWRWDFEQKLVRKIKPYFRWTYGKADAMIFLAREFSARARSYGYRKPVYLETTVVEDNILACSNGQGNSREEKGFTILFLSRVEIAKGIYELLDSFQQLQKRYPDLILKIAGDGKELANAREYAAAKTMANVHFLGWVSGAQKVQIFREADLFVLPSYSEGMPISLLEAMASGLPVITTNVGGIKDFFAAGKMGFFIHPKDAGSIEQQIERLLSEPALIREIGAYNAAYAQERFTAKQVNSRVEAICEEVIGIK
jgi:glycosyltransferase involved in cell wall biosynthesis